MMLVHKFHIFNPHHNPELDPRHVAASSLIGYGHWVKHWSLSVMLGHVFNTPLSRLINNIQQHCVAEVHIFDQVFVGF